MKTAINESHRFSTLRYSPSSFPRARRSGAFFDRWFIEEKKNKNRFTITNQLTKTNEKKQWQRPVCFRCDGRSLERIGMLRVRWTSLGSLSGSPPARSLFLSPPSSTLDCLLVPRLAGSSLAGPHFGSHTHTLAHSHEKKSDPTVAHKLTTGTRVRAPRGRRAARVVKPCRIPTSRLGHRNTPLSAARSNFFRPDTDRVSFVVPRK